MYIFCPEFCTYHPVLILKLFARKMPVHCLARYRYLCRDRPFLYRSSAPYILL